MATAKKETVKLTSNVVSANRLDAKQLRATAKGKVVQFGFQNVTLKGYKFSEGNKLATKWTKGNEDNPSREYPIGIDLEGIEYPFYEGTLQAIAMQLPNIPTISVQFEGSEFETIDIANVTLNGGAVNGKPLIAKM